MTASTPDRRISDMDIVSEKHVVDAKVLDSPPSEVDQGIVKDWDGEEASVKRKIDFILLPILALAFFALQLDRGNTSAVLTSTITKDLHITTNQINVGSQLLSAGIVLAEIPSNIIMQRVGPRVWLSGQLFAWGLVATFQAFVQSYPAFLVTRILLGLCEGGFIPGALYYVSTWYKKDETSLRTSLFFYGQMFSSATSSLISAGLLKLDGRHGLEGWRWVFLVEGVMTLVIGVIFTLLVPPSAGDGRALISFGRWSYFTERESHIIRNRVLLDDPRKARGHIQISRSDIWQTLKQPRIMQHVFLTLVAMSGFQGLTQYTPTLIKTMGFSSIRANVLASVPVYCGIVWLTALAVAADWTNLRGPIVLLAITWNVISYACLRTTPSTASKWHKYGVIAVANVSYCSMHILNVGWLSTFCRTPQERSVAMALVVMAANCAGISGSQIFRTADAPKYLHGLTAICALAGASWVLAAILCVQYYTRRRKEEPKSETKPDTVA
ncbi:Putative Permease of the major facilitator superfamily [Penicillium brasilianum]|uniref:Putative Permease of the major facilitator superfamily n=1 Tax=Penicillium brasilianum TaxID=104259 RepID=A0A0F7TLK4_PENBI|nr:Putative Permease of the major facilitator superfamily [Penicillium brasilianum]